MMNWPFVHNIDPVITKVGGFYIWWYGLCFTVGFLGIFLWLRKNRSTIDLDMSDVYNLTIFIACGILIGGRMVEVFFYEWPYYRRHILHIPAIWLGGMSTHGILLGTMLGLSLFCKLYKRNFLEIADVLVIAGAFILGIGRIGNFIDGQIVGSLTDVWWGVKFPDAEGYRHPVVLYDGIKNFSEKYMLKRNRNFGINVSSFVFFWYYPPLFQAIGHTTSPNVMVTVTQG